jgi:hypothetical protein
MKSAIVESDPTYFSATRNYYQTTLEALLRPDAPQKFPYIPSDTLESFKKTYSDSAFLCRRDHCYRYIDGFQSSKERDRYEAAHERKYRCGVSTCVSFASGFATKSLLNKHNESYHAESETRITLTAMVQAKVGENNSPGSPLADGGNLAPQEGMDPGNIAQAQHRLRQQAAQQVISPTNG